MKPPPTARRFLIALAAAAGLGATPTASGQTTGTGKLLWWNGQSLAGELDGSDADSIRWKSPFFDEAADLAIAELKSISLPVAPKATEDPVSVALRDGSRLFGEIQGLDDTHLTLQSRRHGSLRLSRDAIVSIDRLRGGGVLWNGPFGLQGLAYGAPNTVQPPEGRRFSSGDGGSISTVGLRQRITLPWKLEKPLEVAFRLRSTGRPEFELRLLHAALTDAITTWNNEVILRRGGLFIPLLTLDEKHRSVDLRFFWDPKSGRGAVTTREGKLLGRWETQSPDAPDTGLMPADGIHRLPPGKPNGDPTKKSTLPPEGISIINRGKDLTIESLMVREWSGELPKERTPGTDPAATRIETTAGDWISGKLLRQESNDWIFEPVGSDSSERRIPVAEILSTRFPEPPSGPAQPARGTTTLQFSDGTSLRGELIGLDKGEVKIKAGYSGGPLTSTADGLAEIRWERPNSPVTPFAALDKMTIGGNTNLHGTWETAPDPRLRWRPVGASAPVPLAVTKVPIEITRATPADRIWPKAPALFFLNDGQIAPGDLVSIDQDGASVSVRSSLVGVTEFAAGSVAAIQFPGPELKTTGFSDPGWKFVHDPVVRPPNDGKSISLEAGTAFAHPSILAGDEIQFDLLSSGYGTVRLRMFSDGANPESPSTRLLIAHYGNEVYTGIEESEGNFDNYKQTPVEHNKPVKIRISWNTQQVQTFVNGAPAYLAKFDKEKSPRSGRGLIFEPANLWGNGARTVTLSGFNLRLAPGFTWVPPVAAKAREQALFLPRFRKEDPPAHILVAHTGDLLRGTIESATADRIAFRAGLENVAIPRDRAAAAIWVKPPPPKEEAQSLDQSAKPAAPALPDAFGLPPAPTHWIVLRSGARLALAVESFGPDAITGTSETLGRCRIPADHVHLIRTTEPPRDSTSGALAGWQLVAAPEPSPEGAEGGEASPLVGKVAPKFELPLLGGGQFDLAKEKGHVVILDFWATWCGPCVRALPEMIDAFSRLDPKRVKFIAVNQAESPEIIAPFLKQRGWASLTVALDGNQAIGRAYGVEGIPHTVVIGPDGKVAHVSTGFRPGAAAETAVLVEKLLAP